MPSRPDGSVRVGNVLDMTVESDGIADVDTGNFPRLDVKIGPANGKSSAYALPVKPWIRGFKLLSRV